MFLCVFAAASGVYAQSVSPTPPKVKITRDDDDDDRDPTSIEQMVVKQRITQQKKEHEELLKRGDEALKLSEELETSFEKSDTLTTKDLEKLQELEKVVGKIRSELGGNDDDEDDDSSGIENNAKQSTAGAFKFLRDSTIKLVDELKKTTRFSISAAAIQSSNTVLRIARFLRLKK
jgi:hypothetical protein